MEKRDKISRSLNAARLVIDEVRAGLKPGVSETEIFELVDKTASKCSAGDSYEFTGDFLSGVRTAGIDGEPTLRRIQCGEPFILDLSLRIGELWCDVCRTFFLGEPSKEMKQAYAAVISCQKLAESLLRAGAAAEDIKRESELCMLSLGYGGKMPHHAGHAVGELPFLQPVFEMGCKEKIAGGDIVTLEPGLYFENMWGIRVENDYLVTENGATNLFCCPVDIDYFTIVPDIER